MTEWSLPVFADVFLSLLVLVGEPAMAQLPCAFAGVIVADGVPVSGAVVRAWPSDALVRSSSVGVAADSQGLFCIAAVPSGFYSLVASARLQAPSASPRCGGECCKPIKEFVATTYPRAKANSGKHFRIVLQRAPAFCVRGEVRSRTGVLPRDLAISVVEPDGGSVHSVLHENGRFLLTALPVGTYTIQVSQSSGLRLVEASIARHRFAVKGNTDRLIVWIP